MEDLVICNKSDLTAIANAIRATSNSSETFNVSQLSATASSIIANSTGGGDTPTGPITTEYTYTYDGDTNNADRTWIVNYSGVRVFAKMGEIPEGTLNLVGATIFRTNPSNSWLDRTFTITEEHLTKVINKANVDIAASVPGLIQIYDQMASDFSEFTVLCICTKAGWYDVTFDDWYEIINFPETGVYAYDKRLYGGNDYAKTFTFSATVEGSGGGGNTPSQPTTTIPTKYAGNEFQMFARGICIGDSVTEGSFDNDEGGAIVKRFSYPSILKRLTNIEIANAGIAGATSQTWYEASLNSDSMWGKWVNDEWVWNTNPQVSTTDIVSSSLSYSNYDFAIIHLGINDFGMMPEGETIDNVVANFEVYINNIITKLKTSNNGIKIFLATIIPSYAPTSHMGYKAINQKIKDIAAAADDVYLLDLNTYSEIAAKAEYNVYHPTALGYHKLANEIASYISYIISQNLNEFKDIQFIC